MCLLQIKGKVVNLNHTDTHFCLFHFHFGIAYNVFIDILRSMYDNNDAKMSYFHGSDISSYSQHNIMQILY